MCGAIEGISSVAGIHLFIITAVIIILWLGGKYQ